MPEQHRIAGSRDATIRTIPRPAKMKIAVGLPDVSGGVDLRFSAVTGENAQGHLHIGHGNRGSVLLYD